MCPIYDVLSHFMLFCCKIVIYAVLSRYLFCRNLRAFAWRKIQPRIMPRGEKMTNIRYVAIFKKKSLLKPRIKTSKKLKALLPKEKMLLR